MKAKYIIYSIIVMHMLFVAPCHSDTMTKRAMLSEIVKHIPEALPCHEIVGLRYYRGFPASVVGADDESGKMTSDQYKQSLFKPIHLQKYDDRQKHYILPAYYGDFTDPQNPIGNQGKGVFAGFVAYAVTKIVEPYQRMTKDEKGNDIPGKHYFGFIRPPDQNRIPGGRHVEGIVVPEKKNYIDADKPPIIIPPMAHYEICHSPTFYEAEGDYTDLYNLHLKNYGSLSQVAQLFMDLAAGGNPYDTLGNPKYSYKEDEIPTLLGYWIHFGHQMSQTENNLENIKDGLILLTAPLPLGGSIVSVTDAFISNEPMDALAWGSLSLSVVSDALIIFKVPKAAAVLTKVLPKGVKPDTAVNFVMKNTGRANMTLGGIYAAQGEYGKAFGSVLAGTSDLISLKIENGELSVGKLKPIQNPVCSSEYKKTSDIKETKICSNTKRFITNKLGRFISSRKIRRILDPADITRILKAADRNTPEGRDILEKYVDYIDGMQFNRASSRTVAGAKKLVEEQLSKIGVHISVKGQTLISEADLHLINSKTSLAEKATTAQQVFKNAAKKAIGNSSTGGPFYDAAGKTIVVPGELKIVKANGDIISVSDCDITGDALEMLSHEFNAIYAEEVTHGIQFNISTKLNNKGDPDNVYLQSERLSMEAWIKDPNNFDRILEITQYKFDPNLMKKNINDAINVELDPVIMHTIIAVDDVTKAMSFANFQTTRYIDRMMYVVWRYATQGEFLGVKDNELLNIIRAKWAS